MRPAARAAVAVGAAIATLVALLLAFLAGLAYDTLGVGSARTAVVDAREILSRLRPGSLLLSRHLNATTRRRTVFNAVTAASDYYHVGVVVLDPATGEPLVLDCMANGPTCDVPCRGHRPLGRGGPRIMPVMQFVLLYSLNPGTSSFRILVGGDSAEPEFAKRAWDVAIRMTRYDFLAPRWFLPKMAQATVERLSGRSLGWSDASNARRGVFCSEMAAQMLVELGVLGPVGAAGFAPWSFCRVDTFERHLLGGYRYTQPLMPHVLCEK